MTSFVDETNHETSSSPCDLETIRRNTMSKHFAGRLSKFTNVVKGWQYRWFVLRQDTGCLEYYLIEERNNGRSRGAQHLSGCIIIPSDEDSQTFTLNFASGEIYKIRAVNARERQVWVDQLRGVIQQLEQPLPTFNRKSTSSTTCSRSRIGKNGCPSNELQNLSLSVNEALESSHSMLFDSEIEYRNLATAIKEFSTSDPNQRYCLDDDMLQLKAYSQSALFCLESALGLLQNIKKKSLYTCSTRSNTIHAISTKNKLGSKKNVSHSSNEMVNSL